MTVLSVTGKTGYLACSHIMWQEMKIKKTLCQNGEINVRYCLYLGTTEWQERDYFFSTPAKGDSSDIFIAEAYSGDFFHPPPVLNVEGKD